MVPDAKLQVNHVRQRLPPGAPLSAVYICGTDWPNLDSFIEILQAGEYQLMVVTRGAAPNAMKSLLPEDFKVTLAEFNSDQKSYSDALRRIWPVRCNALIIDDYAWQRDVLRDTFAAGLRPSVIAARDGGEAALSRQDKYATLTGVGYHFAGLSGQHSLWTDSKRYEDASPGLLTELPPDYNKLPAMPGGLVQFDYPVAEHGQVMHFSARAEFVAAGWAIISPDQPAATALFACARHDETGVEEYLRLGLEKRRDVASHFETDYLLMTGFRADFSPLLHRIGTHSLYFVQCSEFARYESPVLFQFVLDLQPYELAARVGLANRYIRGNGIEIGALQKPTKLNGGCTARYIDRMSIGKLLEHYPEMAKLPLQAPDIVDDGQQLTHIAEDSQDFAIANHFLEHCPDPIRSIHNMLRMVKVGGILYLAVPDKRHTFDLRRPVTPYMTLKSAYLSGQRTGRDELFYEWCHLVYNLPPDQASLRAQHLMEEDYSIHYNVWAASDFLNFLMSMRHDFQSPFELAAVVSSENETIVLLERTAGRLPI